MKIVQQLAEESASEIFQLYDESARIYTNEEVNAICVSEHITGFIAGFEKANEWIPVSDRLPDESGRYWCYVKELNDLGFSYFQWNCAYHKEENRWSDSRADMRVTHWKPIPSPPKQLT